MKKRVVGPTPQKQKDYKLDSLDAVQANLSQIMESLAKDC